MNSSYLPSPFVSERFSFTFSWSSNSRTTGAGLPCACAGAATACASAAQPSAAAAANTRAGLVRRKVLEREGGGESVAREAAHGVRHLIEGRGRSHGLDRRRA